MASSQNTQRIANKGGVNLAFNVARVTDSGKINPKDQLPPDMQSDLRDSFEYFARGNNLISRSDFESIIHNFGFNRVQQKEKEAELTKIDSDYNKRSGFDYEFLEKVINLRWYKNLGAQHNGAHQECFAAFRVFDRYERMYIKPADLKQVFAEYLDHPVNDQDIADIMAICDKNNTGSISFPEFKKFYNS